MELDRLPTSFLGVQSCTWKCCSKAEYDTWWPPMLRCPYQSSLYHDLRPAVSRGANSDARVSDGVSYLGFLSRFPLLRSWVLAFWVWNLVLGAATSIIDLEPMLWLVVYPSVYSDMVMENAMFWIQHNRHSTLPSTNWRPPEAPSGHVGAVNPGISQCPGSFTRGRA